MFKNDLSSILKVFNSTITKLEHFTESKIKQADDALQRVAHHEAQHMLHSTEAQKAIKIAEKLKAILS